MKNFSKKKASCIDVSLHYKTKMTVSLTLEGYLPIRQAHKSKHEKYSGLQTIHTKIFKASPAYLALKNKNSRMPEEISHTGRNAHFAATL